MTREQVLGNFTFRYIFRFFSVHLLKSEKKLTNKYICTNPTHLKLTTDESFYSQGFIYYKRKSQITPTNAFFIHADFRVRSFWNWHD